MANVIQVVTGGDCLQAYRDHMPDIAFIDIHLPILTGLELIGQILKIDPEAFIIIISSDSTGPNVQQAIADGAKGFLAKPILRERLLHYFFRCPTIKWADVELTKLR